MFSVYLNKDVKTSFGTKIAYFEVQVKYVNCKPSILSLELPWNDGYLPRICSTLARVHQGFNAERMNIV